MTQSSEGQVIKTTHFFGLIASKHFHILSFPGDLHTQFFLAIRKYFREQAMKALISGNFQSAKPVCFPYWKPRHFFPMTLRFFDNV